MAVVTFWSNAKKSTGQTMSIAAIAASMAIEHNLKILLIATQYDDETLELCFGLQNKNKSLISKLVNTDMVALDSGVEGLSRVIHSGKVSPETIQNYTTVVYTNRLEILYGFKCIEGRQTKEEYLKVKEAYKDIIQNANKYYDIILVDLDKGSNDEMIKQVLKVSDVIVYNIDQKLNLINQYLSKKREINEKNNVILNIGNYDENSKYTVKNIARYLGIRRDITIIPYNTLYYEAASEENGPDFFLKIRKVSPTDKNSAFVKEVQLAVEKILYKIKEVQMKKQ